MARGILTGRYLDGVPEDSRAAKVHGALSHERITPELVGKLRQLNAVAEERGQTLEQMALSWLLGNPCVTSVLIGASRVEQIRENVAALDASELCAVERTRIDAIIGG